MEKSSFLNLGNTIILEISNTFCDHIMNNKFLVLVIDHRLDNREKISTMLSEEGFDVLQATSGEEGIRLALEKSPSLIVLEVMMPNFNGFQTCKELKSKSETYSIPIIFISSLDDTDNKVKGLSIGGADYIVKPFEKDEVLARVRLQIKMREAFEILHSAGIFQFLEFEISSNLFVDF